MEEFLKCSEQKASDRYLIGNQNAKWIENGNKELSFVRIMGRF